MGINQHAYVTERDKLVLEIVDELLHCSSQELASVAAAFITVDGNFLVSLLMVWLISTAMGSVANASHARSAPMGGISVGLIVSGSEIAVAKIA